MAPTLVVVSGPPGGYGKTTLAHAIARTIGCPAICRDELKEGMVHAHPGFTPGPGDPLTRATFPLLFEVLGLLLRAGTSVVAEAAFQGRVWRPELEPLASLATIRIVRCAVDPEVAYGRNAARYAANPLRKAAHTALAPNARHRGDPDGFEPIPLGVPTPLVDTTNGYDPALPDIVGFVNER